MKKDIFISGQSTSTSKWIRTEASGAGHRVIISHLKEATFKLKVIIGDDFDRATTFLLDEFSARLLRSALNRFADEDKWDTEIDAK